jgi:Uma2 family endonuclease
MLNSDVIKEASVMVANPQDRRMNVEDYLELDRTSPDVRYEYIDGHVYAMSGGTVEHAWVAMNMTRLLDEQLQSGPCRVFNSDVRVQVNARRYLLPDVTISCDVADTQIGNQTIRSPHLIVEVLSPSTELFDRGTKFTYYQECPSVEEYVLIGSQRQSMEVYRREGEKWSYRRYRPGQEIMLESLDLCLPFDAIYARVRVPVEDNDTA